MNCASSEASCQTEAKRFEAARQKNLSSSDPDIVAAAEAYGDPGEDNGVSLTFADPGNRVGGRMSAPITLGDPETGLMSMQATVTIRPGLGDTELRAAVAHEGQHLVDGFAFVSSFTANAAWYDLNKNLTVFDRETKAYRLTHKIFFEEKKIFDLGCRGCTLGRGRILAADVDRAIRRILADPSRYGVTPKAPGARLFPLWSDPPLPQP